MKFNLISTAGDIHQEVGVKSIEPIIGTCSLHFLFFYYFSELGVYRSTWCVQVLRSPKEAFAAAMQLWRERCEKCLCLQGDYVEK